MKHTTRSPARFVAHLAPCLLAFYLFSSSAARAGAVPVTVTADFESYAEGFSQHPFFDASGIVLVRESGVSDQQTVDFANSLAPGQPSDAPPFYQGNHFLAGSGFTPGDGWGLSSLYDLKIAYPFPCTEVSFDIAYTNLGTIEVTAFDGSDNIVASDELTITTDQPKWAATSFQLDAPPGAFITRTLVHVTGDVAVGYDNIQGTGTPIPLPPAAATGTLALAAGGIVSLSKRMARTRRW